MKIFLGLVGIFIMYIYIKDTKSKREFKTVLIGLLSLYREYMNKYNPPEEVDIVTYLYGFPTIDKAFKELNELYIKEVGDNSGINLLKSSPIFFSRVLKELVVYKKINKIEDDLHIAKLFSKSNKQWSLMSGKVLATKGVKEEREKFKMNITPKIDDLKDFYIWIENNNLFLLDVRIIGLGKLNIEVNYVQGVYKEKGCTVLEYKYNDIIQKICFNEDSFEVFSKLLPYKVHDLNINKADYIKNSNVELNEDEVFEQITKLGELKKDGILSEEEFNEKKKELLVKIS